MHPTNDVGGAESKLHLPATTHCGSVDIEAMGSPLERRQTVTREATYTMVFSMERLLIERKHDLILASILFEKVW